MSATELAVDATIDRAGIPSGELGSLSERHKKKMTMILDLHSWTVLWLGSESLLTYSLVQTFDNTYSWLYGNIMYY